MEIHAGDRTTGKGSKTEVLFVAPPECTYDDASTFDGEDLSDIELGNGRYLPVVDLFKYLGSMLTRNCRDTVDIDARIKKASAAFGALRGCLFSSKTVSKHAKCVVYVGLVLAILLHGSES